MTRAMWERCIRCMRFIGSPMLGPAPALAEKHADKLLRCSNPYLYLSVVHALPSLKPEFVRTNHAVEPGLCPPAIAMVTPATHLPLTGVRNWRRAKIQFRAPGRPRPGLRPHSERSD